MAVALRLGSGVRDARAGAADGRRVPLPIPGMPAWRGAMAEPEPGGTGIASRLLALTLPGADGLSSIAF